MNYIVAASSDTGTTKKTNQDSLGVTLVSTKFGKIIVAVLCDGMGGYSKGEVASTTVIDAFYKWTTQRLPVLCEGVISDSIIKKEWTELVCDLNKKIGEYGDRSGITLGTTVTAMMITTTRYFILNVGDSRAYEITDKVEIITRDQTIVARELELGLITEEEAENDPRKSVLLQCVGASDKISPDMFYGETTPNTVYMLCSDGFRHEISKDEIIEYLCPDNIDSTDVLQDNIDYLIRINKERDEKDNITAIAIKTCL